MDTTDAQLRHMEAEARMILRNIPGVDVVKAERRQIHVPEHVNRGSIRHAHVKHAPGAQIVITGWSASLHDVHIVYPVDDVAAPAAEIVVLRDQQRRRAREGSKLGAHLPFTVRHPSIEDGYGQTTEIAHMTCDRAALAVIMEQNDHDPRVVADHLRRIVSLVAHGIDAAPDRMAGRRIIPSVCFDGVILRGNEISIPVPLPQHVLAQTTGRLLGDVVGIRSELAGRRIRGAENRPTQGGSGTVFQLSGDQVNLGDKLLL